MDGHTLSVIWRARVSTNPDFIKKYYRFSQFALELNEIMLIEKEKLLKIDSRLRPDQKLYEEGKEKLELPLQKMVFPAPLNGFY